MSATLTNLSYLLASVLFILGLKRMTHPRTAPGGNLLGAVGMLIAVVVTMLDRSIVDYRVIWAGLAVGTAAGWVLAVKVQMTAMPQMVALLNGLGGLASALVSMGDSFTYVGTEPASMTLVTALGGVLIGGVTFTGSVLAFAKLQGLVSSAPWTFPFQKLANLGLLLLCVLFSALFANSPDAEGWLVLVLLLSLALG